jgi:chemotaxis protein methyltransferase CheR
MDGAPNDTAEIELQLLLEAIYLRYGYDFRGYAMQSVRRRLDQFLADHQAGTFLDVAGRALRDPSYFYMLAPYFSVQVTSLFRDPFFFAALKQKVHPRLRSWPHVKIWHAGCATGEEVYSHSILLKEAGIHERCTLYATDISQPALDTAKAGIYSLEVIRKGSASYLSSGGEASLSDYYLARYQAAIMNPELRRRMTFARHNLAMDTSFGEMQVIVCRNVLIYFNEQLQNQVLELFWESMDHGGILCLGDKESLSFTSVVDRFEVVDETARIYKKLVPRSGA